ncbi:MAG TPA: PilZ domain-containing protein [Polyangia bacterium]|nr:PilZ domain-containing protein [Polyangia bacterium]
MKERRQRTDRRRGHARHPLSLTVGVHTHAGRVFGTLYDLSRTGAFLALDPPPGAGARLVLAIHLRDGSELRLNAQVVHSMSDHSPRLVSGVGLVFGPLDPASAERLDALLERLRRREDPRGP